MHEIDEKEAAHYKEEFHKLQPGQIQDICKLYQLEQKLAAEVTTKHGSAGVNLWLHLKLGRHWKQELREPDYGRIAKSWSRPLPEAGSPNSLVETLFGDAGIMADPLLQALDERCRGVYELRFNERDHLVYWLDLSGQESPTRVKILAGGPPLGGDELRCALEPYGLDASPFLGLFSLHNGFGPLQDAHYLWISECILPVDRWERLGYANRPNLVMIAPDALGNGYCIDLESSAKQKPQIVFYEHEGGEKSSPMELDQFYNDYFDALLSQ
jgi:hypothetical protein